MGFELQAAISRGTLVFPAVWTASVSRPRVQLRVREKDEPWGFQQLISLISGFIGSLLSVNAYSQLREAKREVLRTRPALERGSRARIVQQLGGSLLDAEASRASHPQKSSRLYYIIILNYNILY